MVPRRDAIRLLEETVTSALPGRAVISVGGEARVSFLEGLLSCRVDPIEAGELRYGALLTPQGKITCDMFLHAFPGERIALDVPEDAAADLAKRLGMYKLRAAVTVERSDEIVVIGEGPADPRAEGIATRAIRPAGAAGVDEQAVAAYHAARVARGVPDAVHDFALGSPFPHDVNMDITGGVDFHKGCFVGQEVVSRMRHRGTARRRTVIVEADADLPPTGATLMVDGREIGHLGTVAGRAALALVRIDKARPAAEVDGVHVRVRAPERAPFSVAEADAAG